MRRSPRQQQLLDALVDLFLAEGFAQVSGEDLAVRLKCSKSTLYALAPSKEQLRATVVRAFFRRATDRVEGLVRAESDPTRRVRVYLEGIAGELAPASRAFYEDLHDFAPTAEIYARNTAAAARRVREMVLDAEAARRAANPDATLAPVNSAFLGAVTGLVMEGIDQGRMRSLAGMDDAAAFRALADLMELGMAGPVAS